MIDDLNAKANAIKDEQTRIRRARNAEKVLEGYQGWDNYETWAVGDIFIGGDSRANDYWMGRARSFKKAAPKHPTARRGVWTEKQAATFELADEMKDKFEYMMEKQRTESPFTDLLRAAFDAVNWTEIAEDLLRKIDEN